ncbi:MAG: nucleotidyltransferase domain-containing protein [Aquificota bacterium]|nr:nucleotidyltransferase domain-containing protein [Aquificota bacterium]
MKVRLTPQQVKDIKEAVRKVLGKNAKVYLFGSRTDLRKRGGDIDLLVLTDREMTEEQKFRAKMDISVELLKRLGERKALEEGVEL